MTDDQLTDQEAETFGTQLETLCRGFSSKEQEFLRAALRLAVADMRAHADGSISTSSIRDLVLDIHEAGAIDMIILNPLPIPPEPRCIV